MKMTAVILSLAALATSALFSLASAREPANIDPVVIRGDKLPSILGEPAEDLRVFSWDGRGFEEAVFQVDERREVLVYRSWTRWDRVLSYAFDSGPKAKPDPDPALDQDDELAFMASSAGRKAPAGSGPPGSRACDEIEIGDREGGLLYVYVCAMESGSPPQDTRYVRQKGEGVIEGRGYEAGYVEGNPVNFDRLQAKDEGELLPDVVDRMKLYTKVLVGMGIAEYGLGDRFYEHFLRGVRAGPVRVIKEFETVLETWGGVQIRTYNRVVFYPYHIEYNLKARGAVNWGESFNISHLIMGIDLCEDGRGMKFYSQHNLRGELVDGHMSPSELHMDYGPTEWAAVTGRAGTIMVHLGLDRFTGLHRDLFYADRENKADPPEDCVGMMGKFGYIIRDLQKAGFDPFPVRFAVFPTSSAYYQGLEDKLVDMYQSPMKVTINKHELWSVNPDGPDTPDTREERPGYFYRKKEKGAMVSRFLSPSFIIDPNLLGVGPGVSYADYDFLDTGSFMGFLALWTDRGYAAYELTFANLRFIKGADDFEIAPRISSFPAEPYYGQGNETDIEHKTYYWWRRNEVNVTFSKYFARVYGADIKLGYKDIQIDSGIEPRTGEGAPSIEKHFGEDAELEGERWGPAVYGMQGGNHNYVQVSLFRDMKDARFLPKFGNYQELSALVVSSAFGADYDYLNATLDLRAYWHPGFLNPIPWLDENVNPRRTFLTKFIGEDKNRSLAGRVVFQKLFADEINYKGREMLDVPFYDLNYIGSSLSVKGYTSKRFRDHDAVYANIEYRWRWWHFEDMALFYDIGVVMDDLLVREGWEGPWHHGYGFSYRIHKPPFVIVTFEWGWSVEEQAIIHQANVAF